MATEDGGVEYTLIGGPRHGQCRSLRPGSTAWLDIEHAQTYYAARVRYLRQDAVTSEPLAMYSAEVLVWEGIRGGGPLEGQLVMRMLSGHATWAWFDRYGTETPVPAEIKTAWADAQGSSNGKPRGLIL